MLKLYQSNQLGRLVDFLAAIVSEPQQSTFAAEAIVVQHPAMGHWLSLRLAERLGICANITFPLPAGFIWSVFRSILNKVPEHNQFEPTILTWRILELLNKVGHQDLFHPVSNYLANGDQIKHYDLACRIAEAFDQYLLYRPDWIEAWEAGHSAVKGDAWQAALWRRLTAAESDLHWVSLQRQLGQLLLVDNVRSKLPERISIFGLSTLSPGYLEILNCISNQVDVHVFLLNPCAAHWTEIVNEEKKAKAEENADGSELYLEIGHPLLASWGRQGRDFFASLNEYDSASIDSFEGYEKKNLLGQLQQDIYLLHNRTADPKQQLPSHDRSIQFHSCHSVMREIEVLKDQLLDIFQNNPDIAPSDVLVMSPSIDLYAAYIEAVFSTHDTTSIPYQISNEDVVFESPLIAGFFQLLQINKSRLDSNSIIDLLEIKPIQRRFNLEANDIGLILHWIKESGIRWGRDGTEKGNLGLPDTNQNSWCAGLDRMLLGYALPINGIQLFQNIFPYDEIEGIGAAVLGNLNAFMTEIFNLQDKLQGEHTIDVWNHLLFGVIDSFFDPLEQEVVQVKCLRDGIETLHDQSQCANFKGKVSVELIHKHLKTQLKRGWTANRAPSRGVAFCSLASMRSLPYKVICLIGMNDGSFPKYRSTSGFDLMASQFRFGDRVHRADDRYLFLETLVSAQHTLYISFIGQHIRDNSKLPPSGLVNELLDYLNRCYHFGTKDGVRDCCITYHPLQPFSKHYFQSNDSFISYSKEMYQAYLSNIDATASDLPFLKYKLPEPTPDQQQIELIQLIKFFSNPARYFLQHRLGIFYEQEDELLETTEPFSLAFFMQCKLEQSLVENRLAGASADDIHAQIRVSGELPHGCFGDRVFEQQIARVEKIIDRLNLYLDVANDISVEIDICINKIQCCGKLNNIGQNGLFSYSIHTIWKNQLLELWIKHLVLNVLKPSNVQLTSRWLDSEKLYCFKPVDNPEKLLGELFDIYWQGLRQPLHFFSKSSYAYMEHSFKEKDIDECIYKAKQQWCSAFNSNNEADNPYYSLAFSKEDVFDDDFIELSEQVFRPLFEYLEST